MSIRRATCYGEMRKFNPYHDARGRFSSAGASASFTYAPGKSKAHDLAIQREKNRLDAVTEAADGSHSVNTETRGHLKSMDVDEAASYTAKECGISKQEAMEMNKAVNAYSVGDAYNIRAWQTTGNAGSMSAEEAKTLSDRVEKFIERSKKWEGGTLYRGIAVDQATANSIVQKAKSGGKIDMMGTSSWSSDKSIAEDFGSMIAGKTDAVIIFKTGATKKGTSIRHLSDYEDQDEVIISKGARWVCKNVSGGSGAFFEIELEEMP